MTPPQPPQVPAETWRELDLYLRTRAASGDMPEPPLPDSHWQDHWTRTAEANGFTRVRQGKTGPPDAPAPSL